METHHDGFDIAHTQNSLSHAAAVEGYKTWRWPHAQLLIIIGIATGVGSVTTEPVSASPLAVANVCTYRLVTRESISAALSDFRYIDAHAHSRGCGLGTGRHHL